MNLLSKTKFQVFLEIAKVCNHKLLGDYKGLQPESFAKEKNIFYLEDVVNNLSLMNSSYMEKVYFLERFHTFVIKPRNRKNKNDFH